MELLSSRVSLSRECSGKNAGRGQMSTIILLCAARGNCSFMSSNSTKVGMSYSKRPRLASDGQDKRDGKGKENTIPTTLCDRSYATHEQVQPQTYRFIAPRPAVSRTSIQQSTLPCQHSADGLGNVPEKLKESTKRVKTPL